jgi:hypothetical protein
MQTISKLKIHSTVVVDGNRNSVRDDWFRERMGINSMECDELNPNKEREMLEQFKKQFLGVCTKKIDKQYCENEGDNFYQKVVKDFSEVMKLKQCNLSVLDIIFKKFWKLAVNSPYTVIVVMVLVAIFLVNMYPFIMIICKFLVYLLRLAK